MKLLTFFLSLALSISIASAADESPQGSFTLFSESVSTIAHYDCVLDKNSKWKLRCDVQKVYVGKNEGEDLGQARSHPEFQKLFDETGSFKDEYAGEFRGAIDQICPLIPNMNAIFLTDPSAPDIDSLMRDIKRDINKTRFPDFDEEKARATINDLIRKPEAEKDFYIRSFATFSKFCEGGGTDADIVLAIMEIENEKKKKTCRVFFNKYIEDFERVNDDLWVSQERISPLVGCEVIGITRLYRNRDKEVILPVWEMDYQAIPLDEKGEDSLGGACKDRMGIKDVYVSQYGLKEPIYLGCEFIN